MSSDFASFMNFPFLLLTVLITLLLHNPIHELGHYVVSKFAIYQLNYRAPYYFEFSFGKKPFFFESKYLNISFRKLLTSGFIDTTFYDFLALNYKETTHEKAIKDITIAGLYSTLLTWVSVLFVFLSVFSVSYIMPFFLFTFIWLHLSFCAYKNSTDKDYHKDPSEFAKNRFKK